MTEPASPPPEPASITLVRKLILLLLIAVVASLGLVLLLHHLWIYSFSLLVSIFFADAFLGLIAGLSVRWIMRNRSILLRMISTIVFVICALELLGWFTRWQFGIGTLEISRTRVDWLGLSQLLLAVGIACLSLFAWSRPRKAEVLAELPVETSQRRRPRKRPAKHLRPALADKTIEKDAGQALNHAAATLTGPLPDPPARPKQKRAGHRRPLLRLSAEEEHRCPYCLELIVPDDPRGTVECKICHTLHHADCWAITGACQVPHYTT